MINRACSKGTYCTVETSMVLTLIFDKMKQLEAGKCGKRRHPSVESYFISSIHAPVTTVSVHCTYRYDDVLGCSTCNKVDDGLDGAPRRPTLRPALVPWLIVENRVARLRVGQHSLETKSLVPGNLNMPILF